MKMQPVCQLRSADIESALARHIAALEHCVRSTRDSYLATILAFLEFMQERSPRVAGYLFLPDEYVMEWLRHISTTYSVSCATQKLSVVDHFMASMHEGGAIRVNPVAALTKQFGARGRCGIIEALRSDSPQDALEALRTEPAFTGTFGRHATSYLEVHRAAGESYRTNELTLMDFNRFLRRQSADSIVSVTPALVREWHGSLSCSRGCARRKVLTLGKFFGHAVKLGLIRRSPVTAALLDEIRPPLRDFRPYIFTQEQIVALLDGARKLQRTRACRLKPEAIQMLIRLLYTLGLRISEALRLQMKDIDLQQSTLFVRNTKFHKERLLPFGPRFGGHLRKYLDLRRQLVRPVRHEDPLFLGWARVGHNRDALTQTTVRSAFRQLLQHASITAPVGYRDPRVHDLRHSFAVHRLLRWYKDGVNVQNRLVLLATFMGHSSIFSSQIYLTVTTCLLREANARFQESFGALVQEEQRP